MFTVAKRYSMHHRFGRTVRFVASTIMLLLSAHAVALASTAQETINSKDVLLKKNIFANNSSNKVVNPSDASSVAAVGDTSAKSAPDASTPDWNGVWRDTGVIFGWQVLAVGITYALPESFSNWSTEQKKAGWKKYQKNFVNPVLDKDDFYVNYMLHPYWGATYYIRGRERGLDQTYAFMYSAMMSAMYEFGVECIAEKPSIQDLIITPGLGALLGAYVFEPWRESIKRKSELRWYDHTALVVTDPLGVVSLGVEKAFGIKSTIIVNHSNQQNQTHLAGSAVQPRGSYTSALLQIPLN